MRLRLFLLTLLACGGACAPSNDTRVADEIVPGERIGDIRLGLRYREVRRILGEGETVANRRLAFARYPARGLEIVFSTPADDVITDEAKVIAIGARGETFTGGIVPGRARREVEGSLGSAVRSGPFAYHEEGLAIEYDADDRIVAVAVIASWTDAPVPGPMQAFR